MRPTSLDGHFEVVELPPTQVESLPIKSYHVLAKLENRVCGSTAMSRKWGQDSMAHLVRETSGRTEERIKHSSRSQR